MENMKSGEIDRSNKGTCPGCLKSIKLEEGKLISHFITINKRKAMQCCGQWLKPLESNDIKELNKCIRRQRSDDKEYRQKAKRLQQALGNSGINPEAKSTLQLMKKRIIVNEYFSTLSKKLYGILVTGEKFNKSMINIVKQNEEFPEI